MACARVSLICPGHSLPRNNKENTLGSNLAEFGQNLDAWNHSCLWHFPPLDLVAYSEHADLSRGG